MSHPAFFVDQFVRQFLSHWHYGPLPNLNLEAKPNGDIALSLNLNVPLHASKVNEESADSTRRSGQGSRRRRRRTRHSS